MPTIFRFLVTLVILAAIGGAAVFYLAYFVDPRPREMTVRIPADKLQPKVVAPAVATGTPPAEDQGPTGSTPAVEAPAGAPTP